MCFLTKYPVSRMKPVRRKPDTLLPPKKLSKLINANQYAHI